jgi:hypothetical protein
MEETSLMNKFSVEKADAPELRPISKLLATDEKRGVFFCRSY